MRVGTLVCLLCVVASTILSCHGEMVPLSPKSRRIRKLTRRCSTLEDRCSVLMKHAKQTRKETMQRRAKFILDQADLEYRLGVSEEQRKCAEDKVESWADTSRRLVISCRVANRVRVEQPDSLEEFISSF